MRTIIIILAIIIRSDFISKVSVMPNGTEIISPIDSTENKQKLYVFFVLLFFEIWALQSVTIHLFFLCYVHKINLPN